MGIENPVHLIFIGAVALIVLGPKRLPELAKALGNGIREFRESIADGQDERREAAEGEPVVSQAASTPQAAQELVAPVASEDVQPPLAG